MERGYYPLFLRVNGLEDLYLFGASLGSEILGEFAYRNVVICLPLPPAKLKTATDDK
jgi:hypothetical protein